MVKLRRFTVSKKVKIIGIFFVVCLWLHLAGVCVVLPQRFCQYLFKAPNSPSRSHQITDSSCKIPQLDPFSADVRKHFPANIPKVQCKADPPWTEIRNGTFILTKNLANCQCSYVFWETDHTYKEKKVHCTNGSAILSDFLAVDCSHGNETYQNNHFGIHVSDDVLKGNLQSPTSKTSRVNDLPIAFIACSL